MTHVLLLGQFSTNIAAPLGLHFYFPVNFLQTLPPLRGSFDAKYTTEKFGMTHVLLLGHFSTNIAAPPGLFRLQTQFKNLG